MTPDAASVASGIVTAAALPVPVALLPLTLTDSITFACAPAATPSSFALSAALIRPSLVVVASSVGTSLAKATRVALPAAVAT